MSLNKSKCWYSNNCWHFLKFKVPLTKCFKLEGSNLTLAGTGEIVKIVFILMNEWMNEWMNEYIKTEGFLEDNA
jgi:hypothetical protein